ncbi:MAG: GntR family transcriptional regulator [Burkholderiaceae bacterium]
MLRSGLTAFADELSDTALTRDSLASQAYARIRRGLMNGRYQPGQKMILRTLTDELGISPTPIREALARLVSEQALLQPDRRSVRVPDFDLERFREVRALRLELEALGARTAAQRAGADELDALELVHRRLAAAKIDGDFARALEMNERFHLGLCALARMPVLMRIVEGLWLQCGPLMNVVKFLPVIAPDAHPHLIVLRGLRARDGDMAARGIQQDIGLLDDQVIERLMSRLKAVEPGQGEGSPQQQSGSPSLGSVGPSLNGPGRVRSA